MSSLAGLTTAILLGGASLQAQEVADGMQLRLLAGEGLQAGWQQQLGKLEPSDRFALIVWMRRSGMYAGAPVPLRDMLRKPDAGGAE